MKDTKAAKGVVIRQLQESFGVALPSGVIETLVLDVIASETEFNAGNSGSAITLDFTNGRRQKLTLTADCVVTLTGAGLAGNTYQVEFVQDATGGRSVTFAGATTWQSGSLIKAASQTYVATLLWNGTAFLGNLNAPPASVSAASNISAFTNFG